MIHKGTITNTEIGEDSNVLPRKWEKDKPRTLELMSPKEWKAFCIKRESLHKNRVWSPDYEWSQLEMTNVKY